MKVISILTVIGWTAFWLYWLISAFGSKKNKSSPVRGFIGARLGVLVLVALLIRISINQKYSTGSNFAVVKNDWLIALGFFLFLTGLSLAIWARLYLGKNWGMPMSLKQDPELVMSGPYRYIRHPIYSGILLATLGSTLSNSAYWLFVFTIMGLYFIYSAYIEERIMQHQFPNDYPKYKKQTKMLIPFVF
jgi:protein-S-isoprenylcysteine O-methyltransferase Ste14